MVEYEAGLRIFFFIGVLTLIAGWEVLGPKRIRQVSRRVRWSRNLALVVINAALVRLAGPFSAVAVAAYSARHQVGLLHHLSLSGPVKVILSVLALDLLIYGQHVVFHYVPLLWRVHSIHHIDQEIDVTTGLRFHPFEILLSVLIKGAGVLILGIPVAAVVIFEIVPNGTAMFNHGNISLPGWLDRGLRLMVVTPDMHRVHHSVIAAETNSNFGFNIPWWDRFFGTYRAQPRAGHLHMDIGLKAHRDVGKSGLWALLAMPFLNRADDDALS